MDDEKRGEVQHTPLGFRHSQPHSLPSSLTSNFSNVCQPTEFGGCISDNMKDRSFDDVLGCKEVVLLVDDEEHEKNEGEAANGSNMLLTSSSSSCSLSSRSLNHSRQLLYSPPSHTPARPLASAPDHFDSALLGKVKDVPSIDVNQKEFGEEENKREGKPFSRVASLLMQLHSSIKERQEDRCSSSNAPYPHSCAMASASASPSPLRMSPSGYAASRVPLLSSPGSSFTRETSMFTSSRDLSLSSPSPIFPLHSTGGGRPHYEDPMHLVPRYSVDPPFSSRSLQLSRPLAALASTSPLAVLSSSSLSSSSSTPFSTAGVSYARQPLRYGWSSAAKEIVSPPLISSASPCHSTCPPSSSSSTLSASCFAGKKSEDHCRPTPMVEACTMRTSCIMTSHESSSSPLLSFSPGGSSSTSSPTITLHEKERWKPELQRMHVQKEKGKEIKADEKLEKGVVEAPANEKVSGWRRISPRRPRDPASRTMPLNPHPSHIGRNSTTSITPSTTPPPPPPSHCDGGVSSATWRAHHRRTTSSVSWDRHKSTEGNIGKGRGSTVRGIERRTPRREMEWDEYEGVAEVEVTPGQRILIPLLRGDNIPSLASAFVQELELNPALQPTLVDFFEAQRQRWRRKYDHSSPPRSAGPTSSCGVTNRRVGKNADGKSQHQVSFLLDKHGADEKGRRGRGSMTPRSNKGKGPTPAGRGSPDTSTHAQEGKNKSRTMSPPPSPAFSPHWRVKKRVVEHATPGIPSSARLIPVEEEQKTNSTMKLVPQEIELPWEVRQTKTSALRQQHAHEQLMKAEEEQQVRMMVKNAKQKKASRNPLKRGEELLTPRDALSFVKGRKVRVSRSESVARGVESVPEPLSSVSRHASRPRSSTASPRGVEKWGERPESTPKMGDTFSLLSLTRHPSSLLELGRWKEKFASVERERQGMEKNGKFPTPWCPKGKKKVKDLRTTEERELDKCTFRPKINKYVVGHCVERHYSIPRLS